MPFNIYTFVLSEKLASDEYAKRGVSDKDSVRRTALITGFLSPSNGGINGAVVPALFAKEKASRDAEAIVPPPPAPPAQTPGAPPAETPGAPPAQTPPATPPGQQTVEDRLADLESAFATYTDFVGKKVGVAKPELEKNFVVAVKDQTGNTVLDDASPEAVISAQQPDPKSTTKLLKGLQVTLIIPKK